jgi:hypothetical protein
MTDPTLQYGVFRHGRLVVIGDEKTALDAFHELVAAENLVPYGTEYTFRLVYIPKGNPND